ncbi:MAG: ribbon-helix-helix protein, CopG family [Phormidesmis sp. CAN_BIN44]|nr:ribbon-helix-helix protein, CopG family [Phormidesmis sp. CAN_BIN44]
MKTRLDFYVEIEEKALLNEYCESAGRTKSDVLRELIRSLKKKQSRPKSAGLESH